MQNVLCQLVSLNVFAKRVLLEMHTTSAWILMNVLPPYARIMLYVFVLTHQEVMIVDVDPVILVIHLHNVQKKMKATNQMIYA